MSTKATSVYSKDHISQSYKAMEQDLANSEKVKSFSQTARLKDFDPEKDTKSLKYKPDKYMVLQMGQSKDETQDQMLIQYLSENALAI